MNPERPPEPAHKPRVSQETGRLVSIRGVFGMRHSHMVFPDRIEVKKGRGVEVLPRFVYTGHNVDDPEQLVRDKDFRGWGLGWPRLIHTAETPEVALNYARDNAGRHGKKPVVFVIDVERALEPDKSGKPSATHSNSSGKKGEGFHRLSGSLPPGSYWPVPVPHEGGATWGVGGDSDVLEQIAHARGKLTSAKRVI